MRAKKYRNHKYDFHTIKFEKINNNFKIPYNKIIITSIIIFLYLFIIYISKK
jgi:amino acid transporter